MKDKLVILLAKIGVFFANCDGCYDQCEKNFIRNFIALLSEKNFIDSSTNEILEGIEGKVISIDIVIQETKSFVDLLQEIENPIMPNGQEPNFSTKRFMPIDDDVDVDKLLKETLKETV